MGFLSRFTLCLVGTWCDVLLTKVFAEHSNDLLLGLSTHISTIGTHVGYMTSFVEFLRSTHSTRRGEAESSRSDLLKC